MPDPDRPWLLIGFEEPVKRWVREYQPKLPALVAVRAWLKSREEDPFAGVRNDLGLDNYLFGVIPGTLDEDGRVVTCAYWIHREDFIVRCDMLSTASWPI